MPRKIFCMHMKKSTHRPDAPGSKRFPARATGDREETTGTGWPVLMAVGVENGGHESGPLWRYVFSSCLRNADGDLSQLRPNILPIIRPQFFACHFTMRGSFNLDTALQRHTFLASNPIGNNGRGNAQSLRNGKRSPALPVHPVFEVHPQIISHGVSICQ